MSKTEIIIKFVKFTRLDRTFQYNFYTNTSLFNEDEKELLNPYTYDSYDSNGNMRINTPSFPIKKSEGGPRYYLDQERVKELNEKFPELPPPPRNNELLDEWHEDCFPRFIEFVNNGNLDETLKIEGEKSLEVKYRFELEGIPQSIDKKMSLTQDEFDFFEKLERSLSRKGQCILYGPPGTGKTYLARKFIKWANEKKDQECLDNKRKIWLVTKEEEYWTKLFTENEVILNPCSLEQNYSMAQKGDLVLAYQNIDEKKGQLVGLAMIEKSYYSDKQVSIRKHIQLTVPIPDEELTNSMSYNATQMNKLNWEGEIFKIDIEYGELIKNLLMNNKEFEASHYMKEIIKSSNFEICTFHPSFSYEDFIEGYKPVSSGEDGVSFRLESGIFKKICIQAIINPDIDYYLIIDEMNRGNIPKIFGELITMLEYDKRGIEVILPQSKDSFLIPKNLYIIGTMNTSDKSIKLLDVAIKRRFSQIECMPRPELVDKFIEGHNLNLKILLNNLNKKLMEKFDRNKQIGQAYLMSEGVPIKDSNELKEIYETEIIPLIQEYCLDDYETMAEILGSDIIDEESQSIIEEVFLNEDGSNSFIEVLLKWCESNEEKF